MFVSVTKIPANMLINADTNFKDLPVLLLTCKVLEKDLSWTLKLQKEFCLSFEQFLSSHKKTKCVTLSTSFGVPQLYKSPEY